MDRIVDPVSPTSYIKTTYLLIYLYVYSFTYLLFRNIRYPCILYRHKNFYKLLNVTNLDIKWMTTLLKFEQELFSGTSLYRNLNFTGECKTWETVPVVFYHSIN